MIIGCLVPIAAFAIALVFHLERLHEPEIPNATLVAVALAFGWAVTAGCLHGLVTAGIRAAQPETTTSQRKEGASVRIGGRVRPMADTLRSPIGRQEAVAYQYAAHHVTRQRSGKLARQAGFRGLDTVPCFLETASGHLPIRGFPLLTHFPERRYQGDEACRSAAELVIERNWSPTGSLPTLNPFELEKTFSDRLQALPLDMMTPAAESELQLGPERPDVERIKDALSKGNWRFSERVIAPGEEVTVIGTYSMNPPGLDVSFGIRKAEHGIHPGLPSRLAMRKLVHALVAFLFFAGSAVALHWLVYDGNGARYRDLLERIEPL